MMNFSKALIRALEKQNISLELDKIPINIFLKNTGDILSLCFLEEEKEDCMIVVETNINGGEEVRIIPKENIEYISIQYEYEEEEEDTGDVMLTWT